VIVVADTSPLNCLVQIDHEQLLPTLYDRVLVPAAVLEELSRARAVPAVLRWLKSKPSWLIVRVMVLEAEPALETLGPGEREAIQLAKHEHADLVLMDEKLGVRIAREQGLSVTGTLGVLVQGARQGLVDIERALADLQATDFRCTRRVLEEARRLAKPR
jgi:predicted nucleic acid-binding protein